MVVADLDPFEGYGLVSWNAISGEDNTPRHEGYDLHDNLYAEILYKALQRPDDSRFNFFIGYFSDVDARSHQYGAYSEKCLSAVANKTEKLAKYDRLYFEKLTCF